MADFIYPTAIELQQVEQEMLPQLVAGDPMLSDIMPMRNTDAHLLEWEQRDNNLGLQNVRGLNGEPSRVKPIGAKRYQMQPGVYGEFYTIDELQLTARRAWGTFAGAVSIDDLVREGQDVLLQRRLNRLRYIGWTLITTGTFSVADGTSVLHTDSYTTQTYSASVPWATVATATPLADLRAIALKARGYSLSFGQGARAFMNQSTFNAMISNTNANDLAGRRTSGFGTVNSPEAVNQLITQDALANIVVYDQGYYDSTGTFQLWVPNNKVIVVGRRTTGDPLAEYRLTRNANNAGMAPGPYTKIDDDPNEVPRQIVLHDGHNGGPVLYHPAGFVVATV